MVIIMKSDKNLVISVNSKIYQREKLADKLRFLLPLTYEDIDIQNSTVSLEYVDPQHEYHIEVLDVMEDVYKESFLQYILPVDSKLTRWSGDITMKITVSYVNIDDLSQHSLQSSELTISVSPISELFSVLGDDGLAPINQKMEELNAKMQALEIMVDGAELNTPDDLHIDEHDLLQLSVRGNVTGNGVYVAVGSHDTDGSDDSVIDLDGTPDDDGDDSGFTPVAVIDL